MCLTINQKLHKRKSNGHFIAKRAIKDIIVYKRLLYIGSPCHFRTPFQLCFVDIGGILKAQFSFSSFDKEVKAGIHAYQTKTWAKRQVKHYPNCIMVECIIPKNALYYLGNKDIVANKMKINKIIYGKSRMK